MVFHMTEQSKKLFNKAAEKEKVFLKMVDLTTHSKGAGAIRICYQEVRQAWILAAIEKGRINAIRTK